jgi:small subunit ribosomal protein S24e
MEIEIQSKTNNPLLNRTEVHFIIHHEGESTPKRELIRGELAEKLNVKKENIMINYMKSSFGTTDTLGYAKVYKSLKEVKAGEREYILIRNNILVKEKKPAKEEKKKPVEPSEEKPEEGAEKPAEETTVKAEEGKDEETAEKPDEKKEESTEKPTSEEKINEEKHDEKKSEEEVERPKDEEKPAEEKKE